MVHQLPKDGSSASKFSGEASDSTIQINVMTLDSQIHSFAVDKNMQVSLFKETIATDVDVPVGHQRLIFNGNFLQDDRLLSDYHLDNGHTLHLVARRPALVQESSDVSAGQSNRSTVTRGSYADSGELRNWVGANRSVNVLTLDALNTLSEYMHSMEATHSQNGYQQSTSSISHENMPVMEIPTDRSGLQTPEALSSILRLARSLLSGHTVAALSHFPGRLEQAGATSDATIREQIQEESVRAANAMQQLGSLFLELGRVVQTLHMGQTPAESSVNSGPAVFISPLGPNPLMVQVNPDFRNPIPSNAVGFSPVGVGNALRNRNIHINADTTSSPHMSAVGTSVSNGDDTGSTNPTALDLDGLIGVVPASNVAVVDEASRAVVESTDRSQGNGGSATEDHMDHALSHTISTFEDRLNEVIRDLNYVHHAVMLLRLEIRLREDVLNYLREHER